MSEEFEMIKKFSLLIIILLLTACSSAKNELSTEDTGNATAAAPIALTLEKNITPTVPTLEATQSGQNQIANPASKNCIEKGGKLEIRKDAEGGEYGACIFPNGKECEEWALLRGKCSPDEDSAKNAESGSYSNDTYGFKLSYPSSWKLQESAANRTTPFTLKLERENNILTIQVKHSSEKTVINADAPQGGEISNQSSLTVFGKQVPLQVVKLEGQVKSAAASVSVDDLKFRFQLDNNADPQIADEVIREAMDIASSLEWNK
jgi:putative hemolysin